MVINVNMNHHRRVSPAALRIAERRQREDDAPRLRNEVPGLVSLRLEIEDRAGVTSTSHIRRVVVDNAPALFLLPCLDPRCMDGEHDLTWPVMRALRSHDTSFQGSDDCRGSVGTTACPRVVHFNAIAEYQTVES